MIPLDKKDDYEKINALDYRFGYENRRGLTTTLDYTAVDYN